jgi:rRNA maturation endonuclease Nob1
MKLIDLTDMRFGQRVVLRIGDLRNKQRYWWCRCDGCGKEEQVAGSDLRKGDSTSCKECGKKKITGRPRGTKEEFEDITGQAFRPGKVLRFAGYINDVRSWVIECVYCEKEKTYPEFAIKSGRIKSCGCQSTIYRPRADLKGFRSHELEGIEPGPHIGKHRGYICKCHACDQIVNVPEFHLTSGRYKSCGCSQYDKLSERNETHGMSRSREYGIWRGLRRRCNDPLHAGYKNYGGRGIPVCKEWDHEHGFESIIKHMRP